MSNSNAVITSLYKSHVPKGFQAANGKNPSLENMIHALQINWSDVVITAEDRKAVNEIAAEHGICSSTPTCSGVYTPAN